MSLPVSIAELEALPQLRRQHIERQLVEPFFDRTFYTASYANAMEESGATDPLSHFIEVGWKGLLKPYPGFDTWWYWVNHLDPATEEINPAVHYALVGKDAGLTVRPETITQQDGVTLTTPVRRAILFAGFDAEFVIDEVVVRMVSELARWGDVFYLADNWLPEAELAKVRPHTAGAWAIRHGAYDFGSYAMLARELVGWERLEQYDEVLFVNDSTFLLDTLDDLFTTMAARDCAWWGLQATKGLISTADQPTTRFTDPIPLDEVRSSRLATWEDDSEYDFHVGSYFLAFRRPVLQDPVFRRLIDSIHTQNSKRNIVLKYEVGLTHLLIGRGHRFDTFVPEVHPLHPLFTETHFELIRQGFPLLKRYFLAQNHYDVPGLSEWKQRVLALVPSAPVELFEAALVRTTPADRLQRSLSLEAGSDGAAVIAKFTRGRAFKRRDAARPKDPNSWVFAVDRSTHLLPASLRALFEKVRHDPAIEKIVLTRRTPFTLAGTNITTLAVDDPRSRDALYRAGAIFVRSSPRGSVRAPVLAEHHVIVASRDGLILTRSGAMTAPAVDPTSRPVPRPDQPAVWLHEFEPSPLTGFTTSSAADHIAATNDHAPARYGDGWRTGIPAHDFLTMAEQELPDDLLAEVNGLRAAAAGRRIVLLLVSDARSWTEVEPTTFPAEFKQRLAEVLQAHGAVLAVRESRLDLAGSYRSQWPDALDASVLRFSSTQAVLRASDLIWTDAHSGALDATVIDRPVISYSPNPIPAEDLAYDLDHLFPGPVPRSEEEFFGHLDALLADPASARTARYQRFQNLFFDFRDDQNTQRLLDRVRHELEGRWP